MTENGAIKEIIKDTCEGCYGSDEEPHNCKTCGYQTAIDALKEIQQYRAIGSNAVKVNMSQLNNNGWIPCSERLPELTEGTECFKQSKCCLVTLEWWDGDMTESVGWYNQSGVWNDDSKNCKVIAWMELPAPYKKGE